MYQYPSNEQPCSYLAATSEARQFCKIFDLVQVLLAMTHELTS